MLCEGCVRGFILVQGNLMKFGILAFPAWTINDTRLKLWFQMTASVFVFSFDSGFSRNVHDKNPPLTIKVVRN